MSNPSKLFGGEANISGAKSKLVCLNTGGGDSNTYGIFFQFIFRWFNVPYNSLLRPNGYDHEYINGRYPYYYLRWDCDFEHWNFATNSFKNYANYTQMNPGPPRKKDQQFNSICDSKGFKVLTIKLLHFYSGLIFSILLSSYTIVFIFLPKIYDLLITLEVKSFDSFYENL